MDDAILPESLYEQSVHPTRLGNQTFYKMRPGQNQASLYLSSVGGWEHRQPRRAGHPSHIDVLFLSIQADAERMRSWIGRDRQKGCFRSSKAAPARGPVVRRRPSYPAAPWGFRSALRYACERIHESHSQRCDCQMSIDNVHQGMDKTRQQVSMQHLRWT